MKKAKMDWRIFFKAVVTIALPIAFQNLLSTTASMVDTIMIGSEGELAVAAVGICSQISSLFFSCYFGFAGGSLLFFSQYFGASDEKGINKTFGVAFLCMTVIAVLFAAAAVTNPALVLSIYTDKQNIIEAGIPYLRIVALSYPLQVISVLISFLMRSTERVKAPLFCSVAGLITNFVLNWLLIYGRFGLPKMGASGAAVGTLCSAIVNLTLLTVILIRDKESVRLHVADMFRFDGGFLKIYFSKCLPILCNEFLYGIGQMLINMVIGRQSESAIAAMAAFRVLEGFVFAFFGGLADAASVVVGREVGGGNHMMGYHYTKGFAIICPAITFTICMISFTFNRPLLTLFGLGAEALYYGKYMLLIYIAAGTIRTCNYIMNCCYRSGGEAVFGTVLEVSCLFAISVPATWIAGMVLHLPFLAVFAFLYTDEIIRLIVELWYTKSGRWVKPVTEEGRKTIEEFRAQMKTKKSS